MTLVFLDSLPVSWWSSTWKFEQEFSGKIPGAARISRCMFPPESALKLISRKSGGISVGPIFHLIVSQSLSTSEQRNQALAHQPFPCQCPQGQWGERLWSSARFRHFLAWTGVAMLVPLRKLWFNCCGFACGKFQIKLKITVQWSLYLYAVPSAALSRVRLCLLHLPQIMAELGFKQLPGENFLLLFCSILQVSLVLAEAKVLAKVERNNVRFHH